MPVAGYFLKWADFRHKSTQFFVNLEIVEILCIGRSHNGNQNMAASLRVMFIEFYESLPKFAEDHEGINKRFL